MHFQNAGRQLLQPPDDREVYAFVEAIKLVVSKNLSVLKEWSKPET
jgi:hypothetical protein